MLNYITSRMFRVQRDYRPPSTARLERGGIIMFAIVQTGGKQYKVTEGLIFNVEKLDANVGDKVKLDVLLLSNDKGVVTGNPVKKAYVECEVVNQAKYDKVIIFKFRAKKNSRRRQGHRQPYTALKVLAIKG